MERRKSQYDKKLSSEIEVKPFTSQETCQFRGMDKCVDQFGEFVENFKTKATQHVSKNFGKLLINTLIFTRYFSRSSSFLTRTKF